MGRAGKEKRSDDELARSAAGGDARAFEEIYERHAKRVYAIALRMTGNTADAEDLAQESFVSLLQKIGSFRGEASFATWLYRLTVNQVLMHFRTRRRRPQEQPIDTHAFERGAVGAKSSAAPGVIDRIAIERAVGALPEGYRAAFVLHDVHGREHEEIARELGCAVGTSKSQLHRARARLRELLSPPRPLLQT